MIKYIVKSFLFLLVSGLLFTSSLFAQDPFKVSGVVKEATLNVPLESVLISVAGENTSTDKNGEFDITVNDPYALLVAQIPGFTTRIIELNGRTKLTIFMVDEKYMSIDDEISTPLGSVARRDMIQSGSYVVASDLVQKANSSLDQVLQGKLQGTQIIMGSGMPGSKGFIAMRGLSSLYGHNEPLVIVDEMIHPIHYAKYSAIDGFSHNPFDLVDVDDIESVSVFNDGNSYLGSNGSNGVIYINSEQKGETSSSIVFNAYGGIAFSPKRQSLLDAGEFRNLFNDQLSKSGLSEDQINSKYSFLNSEENTEEYYRYNNNTDWQNEIYQPGVVQKYHLFLKGGDNIATYNISTGYLIHDGILKNTHYNRFNVRINGKVNISDKFTISPNTKLSLADSYLMEQGYNVSTNPILAAQIKSPLMSPMKIDANGKELDYIDDIGAFNISNPTAIVNNVEATNRNYHFITSVKGEYSFTKNLSVSTFVGINFNNSRDNVFIPDVGLSRIDSAYNTMRAMVNEFRSTQNQNQVQYQKSFNNKSDLDVKVGHRYVQNTFEYDKATDLNSTTDDFKSLGQGASNQELRTINGENRVVKWVSYYATADYNYQSKYYLSAALSYDATSAMNSRSRYNFFPSVTGAWRLSSEPFLAGKTWLDDLKIRASFSQTGNMNNFAYDYCHLYYRGLKLNDMSVAVRESVPNPDMEMERQTTINVGIDAALLRQTLNFSVNVFNASVNNLITRQAIPPAYGYTSYYSNAGALQNMGAEFSFSFRKQFGRLTWNLGCNLSYINNEVTSLDFISEDENMIVHQVEGVSLVTKAGEPLYSYYGLQTDGIFNDDGEASQYTGPNGQKGKAGDIRYIDRDGNKVINNKDKTIIGSPISPVFGGLCTSLEFGNFKIKANFSFSAGNDVYSHINKLGQSMTFGFNQQKTVTDRWTTDNTNTSVPGISIGDYYGNSVFSDRWLEKGDYARLNNLTISYDYPATSRLFENLTIYLTATNLFTITSYSGLDPEFMLYNDPLYLSNDYGKMPQPKMVVIGLKLGL
ncbi:MAG: SusC/RagA family TonB-linked outer membrane protein [Prolixibacteraceae bacterium]|nr:SusC/RagA family TonB-linked outer membrane protein [Prolixibacteraceae bacterium]